MEKTPYDFGEPTSKYELWINKSNDLPYYVRREMSHDISVTYCRDIELNKIKLSDFVATDYFPAAFPVYQYGQGNKNKEVDNLTGKVAPDWILNDADSNTFALKDFKSKVLMIQFTSVTCGPCKMSTHFLNQLANEYNKNDFDFVSIESWTRNANALKVYKDRNKITYRFLMSTKEVTGSYQVKSVPVFYLLDKDRVVRKIINGYGTGTTDKEIRDAIKELL
jgi:thiol-disulfide isomerase/thioredoxin